MSKVDDVMYELSKRFIIIVIYQLSLYNYYIIHIKLIISQEDHCERGSYTLYMTPLYGESVRSNRLNSVFHRTFGLFENLHMY